MTSVSHNRPNLPSTACTFPIACRTKCARLCSEWCIVGYGRGAMWDLWNGYIAKPTQMWCKPLLYPLAISLEFERIHQRSSMTVYVPITVVADLMLHHPGSWTNWLPTWKPFQWSLCMHIHNISLMEISYNCDSVSIYRIFVSFWHLTKINLAYDVEIYFTLLQMVLFRSIRLRKIVPRACVWMPMPLDNNGTIFIWRRDGDLALYHGIGYTTI